METRILGRSGIAVSAIGLGCMGLSDESGNHDDAQSLATLERALDLGVNFLDTADMYGCGHNERLLGQFLAAPGQRDRVVLASKFGVVRANDGTVSHIDNSPDYIRAACDASLKRLGVDVIDVYYVHRIDARYPVEETIDAMAKLVTAGKVRALGVSHISAETLHRVQAVHPIAAVQSEYSLWNRSPEIDGVLAACRDTGAAFVAYSPLGCGILTGGDGLAADDFRRLSPDFRDENLRSNLALVAAVKELAAAKGCTSGQLVLAWLLAQGDDVVPIPGTRRIPHLEQNVAAVGLSLSPAEIRAISQAVPPGSAA
jgi:aryl-alcohol dehydrogenase-like predicted oxidoreductase